MKETNQHKQPLTAGAQLCDFCQTHDLPDNLPHLLETLVLHKDKDRGDLVCKHVGVGGGGEPLTGHRDNI